MFHETLAMLARIATIALTPVILFYALAALHSEEARESRRQWGSFWYILLAAFFLGLGELSDVYAHVSGNGYAQTVAALARLAVFIIFLLKIREKLRASVHEHLKKRRGGRR